MVEGGETIEITDRGRPVALLGPLPDGSPLERLRAAGESEPAEGDLDDLPPPLSLAWLRVTIGGPGSPAPGRAVMPATYLDSSALVKLAIEEPESGALRAHLRRRKILVSSALARTEVLRALLLEGEEGIAGPRCARTG